MILLIPLLAFQSSFAGLPADNVPKISLKNAPVFVVPPSKPTQPKLQFNLPKGVTKGVRPYVFQGASGAIVSVIAGEAGPTAQGRFIRLADLTKRRFDTKRILLARPWIGVKQLSPVSRSNRMGLRVSMYSEAWNYTMLASWPDGDQHAQSEAQTLVHYIVRSIRRP